MDREQLQRAEAFVRPLYQDLDGVSRFADVQRISAIARRLYSPADENDELQFELLLLCQGLSAWLGRVGSLTRASLATGIEEARFRRVAETLRRLDEPDTPEAVALAAAIRIDGAGLRGLAALLASARREGRSMEEVAREELAAPSLPAWMPLRAREWYERRSVARRQFCRELQAETELSDLESGR